MKITFRRDNIEGKDIAPQKLCQNAGNLIFNNFHLGGKVLIVIGGDDQYKDEDEEERAVISRWARRKVASQFTEQYLDGRESFVFSWDKQHREIHEEALLHYFDPSKKGQKFEYQPKPKPVPVPQTEEPKVIISPPAAKGIQKEVGLCLQLT